MGLKKTNSKSLNTLQQAAGEAHKQQHVQQRIKKNYFYFQILRTTLKGESKATKITLTLLPTVTTK